MTTPFDRRVHRVVKSLRTLSPAEIERTLHRYVGVLARTDDLLQASHLFVQSNEFKKCVQVARQFVSETRR